MKLIPLTQGKFAKVDDADFRWLNRFNWQARRASNGGTFYASRSAYVGDKRVTLRMHREILGTPPGVLTDHEDGDGLNNQRYNIRCAVGNQNNSNCCKSKNNTSGFKGVHWDRRLQRWRGRISVFRKKIHLGLFDDRTEAARAYDIAALEYFGDFARCNFSK